MTSCFVADSTLWFGLDQRLEGNAQRLEHLGWREEPHSPWEELNGHELKGRSGEWNLAKHTRDLPVGSTVMLVAGWNLRGWEAEAESQLRELQSLARERSWKVARVTLYEGGADGYWALEKTFMKHLAGWPVYTGFRHLYSGLDPWCYEKEKVQWVDKSHRVWEKEALKIMVQELTGMATQLNPK